MNQNKSPIEESTMVLEELIKKSLADPARKAAPAVVSGAPAPGAYTSDIAPQIMKTVVCIISDNAKNLLPEKLPTKANIT